MAGGRLQEGVEISESVKRGQVDRLGTQRVVEFSALFSPSRASWEVGLSVSGSQS